MARYGKVLLLAVLTGLLLTDIEALPRFLPGTSAPTGTAIAAEAGGSTPGITVTRPVPSVSESLSDVQARSPSLQESSPRDRHIPFRRIPRSTDAGLFAPQLSLSLSPAAPVIAAPLSRAPALDDRFAGLSNLDAISGPGGRDVIPPDTMGAAGPGHLVSLLNSQFGVFGKTTGLLQSSVVTLEQFWSSLDPATDNASRFVFDPKILYDTNSGRFIAVTLSVHNDAPPSWIMIAVSSASDPSGPNPWVKVAIRADLDNNAQQFTNWADYPGLGVDASNIYVTANMFNTAGDFQYSKVWVIPKDQPLFNGMGGPLTWTEIRAPQGFRDSMQPAHTFGAPGTEYFIYEGGNQLFLAHVDNITGTPVWIPPVVVSGVAPFTSSGTPALPVLPVVPQAGNPNGIDASDTRLLNAVYRNGFLWTTHHVAVGGKIEVRWYQINPSTGAVTSQGPINDSNRGYFYPSIAVNANNDVAIGFSGSSAAEYASAYYTARRSSDPAGVMQPPSLLKNGVAPYLKAGITFGGTETDNRWGDFSATVVDPDDNVTFWTLQEYAESPAIVDGSLRSMWGTWWGKFRAPVIAAPTLTAVAISTTQVDLAWTIQTGQGQTGFRVERRQLPGGDFGVITPANLGPTGTTYTDNTGTAGTTYSYRVRALSPAPGPDSYSNEATAVTLSPPPIASGGGGGGGCTVSSVKTRYEDFSTRATAVLVLFLPLFLLGARRRIRLIVLSRVFAKNR